MPNIKDITNNFVSGVLTGTAIAAFITISINDSLKKKHKAELESADLDGWKRGWDSGWNSAASEANTVLECYNAGHHKLYISK